MADSFFVRDDLESLSEAATRGVLQKKGVLRNFTKFTGKHLCQSLLFNKVAGLRTTASGLCDVDGNT